MRYHFAFLSSYRCESDFEVTEPTGERYRVHLRYQLDDSFPFNPAYVEGRRDHETSIGILRCSAARNRGEVSAATLDAFNAWCTESGRDYASNAGRGFWTRETGWTRV
jgi:hypothetical protein